VNGRSFVHTGLDARSRPNIPFPPSQDRLQPEDPGVEHLSDEDLLELTPRRPAAFEQIYIRHERLILAYFRRRTRSADLAVDLTAETFVAALAGAKRFKRGDTPAVGWLLGIARHKLLRSIEKGRVEDRARKKLGTQRLEFDDEDLDRVDRLATTPVDTMLATLPQDQADAIRARILDEQSYDVIAARLRCSPLVARKRVSRGLATLRDVMEER
jgi:RNA polymerase sigma factor (sigma-70 family)